MLVPPQSSGSPAGFTKWQMRKVQARSKVCVGEVGGSQRLVLVSDAYSQLGWSVGAGREPKSLPFALPEL
jgi:hypothetical protein